MQWGETMLVCICNGVSDKDIENEISEQYCGAGSLFRQENHAANFGFQSFTFNHCCARWY